MTLLETDLYGYFDEIIPSSLFITNVLFPIMNPLRLPSHDTPPVLPKGLTKYTRTTDKGTVFRGYFSERQRFNSRPFGVCSYVTEWSLP